MLRVAVHILVVCALLFQGAISVAEGFPDAEHESQQHCAGHDMAAQDCACCPEGVGDANCTVQCSVLQMAEVVQTPRRVELRSDSIAMSDAAVRSRCYAPIDPPPIF